MQMLNRQVVKSESATIKVQWLLLFNFLYICLHLLALSFFPFYGND
jgi:hypothetical protein